MNALVESCRTARVIVTCGTGGVGKTSCAAAVGLIAARMGRRAVVVTIDPARRLGDAIGLGASVTDKPVRVPVTADGELWVSMLDVRATFDGLITATARNDEQAQEILANPFYRGLSNSLSGTRDYMAAARLWSLSGDPRFDLVVVDTPPSRNALDFLESPERLARFLSHPLVRMLIAQGRGGARIAGAAARPVIAAIGKVVGGDALAGVVAFLRSIDGMESAFRDRALGVSALLRGGETSFALVVAPTADATSAASALSRELSRLDITLGVVIENRVPPWFGDDTVGLFPGPAAEHRAALEVLERFGRETALVHPDTPHVRALEAPEDIHDLAGVTALADQLSA
ncbi:MAG: ArsA family ATPase [Ilumatobacteraceae bacterium]